VTLINAIHAEVSTHTLLVNLVFDIDAEK